jgi:hypothetical protein
MRKQSSPDLVLLFNIDEKDNVKGKNNKNEIKIKSSRKISYISQSS